MPDTRLVRTFLELDHLALAEQVSAVVRRAAVDTQADRHARIAHPPDRRDA